MVLRTKPDSETSQYHSEGAKNPQQIHLHFFWIYIFSGDRALSSRFSASLEETLHKDGVETSGASLWADLAVGHLQVTCRPTAGVLQVITGHYKSLQVITGHYRSLQVITGHYRLVLNR